MTSPSQNFFCALLRRASGRNLLLLLLLYVQFVAVLVPWAGAELKGFSGGTGPLGLLFTYTPEEAYTMLKAYGAQGRFFYAALVVTVDVAYPLVYTLLLVGLLLFFYSRIPGLPDWFVKKLILVPVLVMLTDFAENICILTLLIDYPYPHYGLAAFASGLTSLKWILATVTLALVLLGAGCFATAALRTQFRKRVAKLSVRPNEDLP